MKIGFFGDSFCSEISNLHSIGRYETYIKKIKNHYDATVVNLGVNGSSCWDTILKQFDPFKDSLPDVCIFVWTEPNRLYHPSIRSISYGATQHQKIKHGIPGTDYYNTWKAAEQYYKYLHDPAKAQLENLAVLYYFDKIILPQYKSKFIHMWSFNPVYDWTSGTEIKTPLYSIIADKDEGFKFDLTPNHIAGDDKNNIIADWLISAIDNYE
jgi:hypothetical protein